MFRLGDVERQLERRCQKLRGMRFASLGFALVCAPLLVLAAVRYLLFSETSFASALPWIGFPFLCAAVAFAIGWARRPDLPRLLLAVDLALGTGERLSALHELRETHRGRPFRRQIEASLEHHSFDWKRGLPMGSAPLLVAAAGAIALAGAVLLLSFEPRASARQEAAVPTPSTAPQATNQRSVDTAPMTTDGVPGQEVPSGSASTPSNGMPEQTLENLLAGIWGSPESKGVLSESGDDVGKLSANQSSGKEALRQLLSQIEKRLAQSPGPLTPQERGQLSNLIDQIPDQSLRQALESLLKDEGSDALKDAVAEARLMAETDAPPDGAAAPGNGEQSPTSPGESKSESGTMTSGLPGAQKPESSPENGVGTSRGEPDSPSEDGGPDAHRVQGDGDSPTGGDETTPPSSATDSQLEEPRPAARFVPEDISGIVGTSGDYREFLTKGVPLETTPGSEGGAPQLSLDYEKLRAILTGRSLPPGAQDSVRRYFESVTQGGP